MITKTILKAIEKIKELGFKVYIPNDKEGTIKYAHYSDGVNVGYFQEDYFKRGITISTIHKPNRVSGSGYGIFGEDNPVYIEDITKEKLEMGFILQPNWADRRQQNNPPEKYTLDEWLKNTWSGKRAKLI